MANCFFESSEKRPFKLKTKGVKMSKTKQLELQIGGSSHVRMSADEYSRIERDSIKSGKSIPELLRESYFSKPPLKVLFQKEDLITL